MSAMTTQDNSSGFDWAQFGAGLAQGIGTALAGQSDAAAPAQAVSTGGTVTTAAPAAAQANNTLKYALIGGGVLVGVLVVVLMLKK